jgi:trimeric autotransporter adhesin
MNTGLHNSLSARLFRLITKATIVAALFLVPFASPAQTGNTATGVDALFSNTTGSYNTADGYYALYLNTAGTWNTAIGFYSLYNNTKGNSNTATGYSALYSNTSGTCSTATGEGALYSNTTGTENTATGQSALYSNTTGFENTATGGGTLSSNTTGYDNTATGLGALGFNTTGNYNTANGVDALYSNTTGNYNTANGVNALTTNTTGDYNTANGGAALAYNKSGTYNTANGYEALYHNTTGSQNTADGFYTLYNATTGNGNFALGFGAGRLITTGNDNIDIGNTGTATDSGIIRIGTGSLHSATYIAGISGVTASGGVAVYINANGQLGTLTSSRRFKNDIKAMGSVSDKLMKLRPVMFRYKDTAEKGPHALQYGLIAEEVAKVYPNLVQYDKAGKPFTVYYHLLTPMLLNELQKAHHRYEAQQRQITSLQVAHRIEIVAQNRKISALTAMLQNQSAELASLRQMQRQQLKVLARLAADPRTTPRAEPQQAAILTQH